MTELHQFFQHLKQPEYVHVLLNPLPVYATAMGVVALGVSLAMRNRQAQIIGLIILIIGCVSVWPVEEFGEHGYDRVYSMSNHEAQQWLDVHMHRADQCAPVFYATAVSAALAILAGWKYPNVALKLTVGTLALSIVCVGLGGWIGHAGGQVRHSEFRDGPPPKPVEHIEHAD